MPAVSGMGLRRAPAWGQDSFCLVTQSGLQGERGELEMIEEGTHYFRGSGVLRDDSDHGAPTGWQPL